MIKHILSILDLELPRAERVSDVLNGVTEAVGVVIGRVDAPLTPSPWVRLALDPVCNWILLAVLQGHLHAQCCLTLLKQAIFHVLEIIICMVLAVRSNHVSHVHEHTIKQLTSVIAQTMCRRLLQINPHQVPHSIHKLRNNLSTEQHNKQQL